MCQTMELFFYYFLYLSKSKILSTAHYQIYSRHDRSLRKTVLHIFVHDLFGANLRISILDPKERARKVFKRLSLEDMQQNYESSKLFFNKNLNAFQSSYLAVFIIPIDHKYFKNKNLDIRFDLFGNFFTERILLEKFKETHLVSDFLHYAPEYFDKLSSQYKLVLENLEKIIEYQNHFEKNFIHNEDKILQKGNHNIMSILNELPNKILSLKNINKIEEKSRLCSNEIELYNACSRNLCELYSYYKESRNIHIGLINKFRQCSILKKKLNNLCQKYLSKENESEFLEKDLINFKNFLTVKDLEKFKKNSQACFKIKNTKKFIQDFIDKFEKIKKKDNIDQIVPIYTVNQNYKDCVVKCDNIKKNITDDTIYKDCITDDSFNKKEISKDSFSKKEISKDSFSKDRINENSFKSDTSHLYIENSEEILYLQNSDKDFHTEEVDKFSFSDKAFVLSIFIVFGFLFFGFLQLK